MRKFKCIRSYESGEWLTKGKIYTEDNGRFRYDDGWIDTTFDYDNAHFDDNNKVSDYLEEIKEDKKVDKFKVGDVVEIIGNSNCHRFKIGDIVELYEDCGGNFKGRTSKNETCFNHIKYSDMKLDRDYMIGELNEYCSEYNCDDCVFKGECDEFDAMTDEELLEAYSLAFENDQSKAKSTTSKTITITTSNTTTTLTDGTHTTSINRYYTDKHNDMVALEEVVKKYKSEMEEINKPTKGKDLIGVYIPEGTKFRVINVEPHRRDNYVCLDEYIGKVATFNSRGFTFENNSFHYAAIFEEDYMNAIDKKNGRLCWRYDEVEILWEEK